MTGDRDGAALLARAVEIADEVLYPAALAVDRSDRVPVASLDLLAVEGLYGIGAPPGVDLATAAAIVAALAGGCLATTFVWLQHHSAVRAAAASDRPGIAARWLAPLAAGERRSGIALAGLRPGAAGLRVAADGSGYRLDGEAPWVTGWDLIDVVYLAARDDADVIHYFLLDAVAAPSLAVRPLDLVAARASRTVHLRFDAHHVGADRLVGTQPYAEWARADATGSTLNGFLALGVVGRCCRMLGPSRLDADLAECHAALLAAAVAPDTAAAAPAVQTDAAAAARTHAAAVARADSAMLALRATAAVAVHTGSRAVLPDSHAQRLQREAAFLLVFGSRPAIRAALLDRLGVSGAGAAGSGG